MTSNQTLILSLLAVIAVAAVAIGLRFRRMDVPLNGGSLADTRRLGLVLMIAGPVMFLFMSVGVVSGVLEF